MLARRYIYIYIYKIRLFLICSLSRDLWTHWQHCIVVSWTIFLFHLRRICGYMYIYIYRRIRDRFYPIRYHIYIYIIYSLGLLFRAFSPTLDSWKYVSDFGLHAAVLITEASTAREFVIRLIFDRFGNRGSYFRIKNESICCIIIDFLIIYIYIYIQVDKRTKWCCVVN
jgi:hypothetical protein